MSTVLRIIVTPEPCGLPFPNNDGGKSLIWVRFSYLVNPEEGAGATTALPWRFMPVDEPPRCYTCSELDTSGAVTNLRSRAETEIVREPTLCERDAFKGIWEARTPDTSQEILREKGKLAVSSLVQGMATLPAKIGAALRATHYVTVPIDRVVKDEKGAISFVIIKRSDIESALPNSVRIWPTPPATSKEDPPRALKRDPTSKPDPFPWLQLSYGNAEEVKLRTLLQTDDNNQLCWKLQVRSDPNSWLVKPLVGAAPPEPAEYAKVIDDFEVFRLSMGQGWLLDEATDVDDAATATGALSFFVLARVLRLSAIELNPTGSLILKAFAHILKGKDAAGLGQLADVIPALATAMEATLLKGESSTVLKTFFGNYARVLQQLASWDTLKRPEVGRVLLKDSAQDNRVGEAHAQLEWNSYFSFLSSSPEEDGWEDWTGRAKKARFDELAGPLPNGDTLLNAFLANVDIVRPEAAGEGALTPQTRSLTTDGIKLGFAPPSASIQGDENGPSDGLLLLARRKHDQAFCANWTAISEDADDAPQELKRLVAALQPQTAEWHDSNGNEHEWWSLHATYRGEPLMGERPDAGVVSVKAATNPMSSLLRLSWCSDSNAKTLGLRFGANFSFLGMLCDSAGGLPWNFLIEPQAYETPPFAERLDLASVALLASSAWSSPAPYLRKHHAGEIGIETKAKTTSDTTGTPPPTDVELCPQDVELHAERLLKRLPGSEPEPGSEPNVVRVLLRSGNDVASPLMSAAFELTPPRVTDLRTIVQSGWSVALKMLAAERFLANTSKGDVNSPKKRRPEIRDPGVVGLAFRITSQGDKPIVIKDKDPIWTVDQKHLTPETCAVKVQFRHSDANGISFFINDEEQKPLGAFAKIEVGYQYSPNEWSPDGKSDDFLAVIVLLVERVTPLPTSRELRNEFGVKRGSAGVLGTLNSARWPSIASATVLSERWTWRNLPLNDVSAGQRGQGTGINSSVSAGYLHRRYASGVPNSLVVPAPGDFVAQHTVATGNTNKPPSPEEIERQCVYDFEKQCAYDTGFLRRNDADMVPNRDATLWKFSDSLADLGDRTTFLRYGLKVASRYAPIMKAAHQTASTLLVEVDSLDPTNWPYRGVIQRKQAVPPKEIDAPRILAVLPLTRTLEAGMTADASTPEATPALVLCDGEWFSSYGLGDRLVAKIVPEDIVPEDERAERVGPLPTHHKAGVRPPKPIGELLLIGPFGYSIDVDEVQARANCSAFIVVPPADVKPHYFASLTFQRKLDGFVDGSATTDPTSLGKSKAVGPFSWYSLKGNDRLYDPQKGTIDRTRPYLEKEHCNDASRCQQDCGCREGYRNSGVAFYRYFRLSCESIQGLKTQLPATVSELSKSSMAALSPGDRVLEVYCDPASCEPGCVRRQGGDSESNGVLDIATFFEWLLPTSARGADANGRIERISDPMENG